MLTKLVCGVSIYVLLYTPLQIFLDAKWMYVAFHQYFYTALVIFHWPGGRRCCFCCAHLPPSSVQYTSPVLIVYSNALLWTGIRQGNLLYIAWLGGISNPPILNIKRLPKKGLVTHVKVLAVPWSAHRKRCVENCFIIYVSHDCSRRLSDSSTKTDVCSVMWLVVKVV